uniref:protein indeterminate-domain 2-like n=1 Tax=Fragaria vesca subsp. vesca TaxID=101020 RepID=UPI0005C96591|nr:PREDICTED: protein indeterminate-domain 2-like [Fragaria vesca subsp. vesca]
MSNITGDIEEGSFSSGNTAGEEVHQEKQLQNHLHGTNSGGGSGGGKSNSNGSVTTQQQQQQPIKKKRNLPGTPDPSAEVIALSPTTLMATNRFVCEICNKGFQRDQNLQLHRRGHNLPWKLRQRTSTEVRKRVYICPEPTCVHHNPARALGDLTGIKKHFSRKHGEKKWKCDKCSKKYAVQSDWKAHQKTCGTREYKCDCGTIFSRRDSFITHRAFCDALAEENNKVNHGLIMNNNMGTHNQMPDHLISSMPMNTNTSMGIGAGAISEYNNYDPKNPLKSLPDELVPMPFKSIMNTNLPAGGGMFSTSSGSLFGGSRSVNNNSSTSSSLQLSSNNSSSAGFNYLQDSKNGCGGSPNVTGSAQMSATALLQKAAQMGATASNTTINSPMMQKSFVSSMAGPENHHHLSNNSINVTRPPYDHHPQFQQVQQQQLPDHHQMAGMHGFTNQLFGEANSTSAASSAAMSDHMAGMFSQVVFNMGSGGSHEQNQALLRNLEQQRFGGSGGEGAGDMTTLDLLGLGGGGGARPQPQNLHEQHQQRLDLEAMSQQQPRMPMMNPFQQRSHGDSPVESNPFGM